MNIFLKLSTTTKGKRVQQKGLTFIHPTTEMFNKWKVFEKEKKNKMENFQNKTIKSANNFNKRGQYAGI